MPERDAGRPASLVPLGQRLRLDDQALHRQIGLVHDGRNVLLKSLMEFSGDGLKLRRAALMLRNVAGVALEPATENALNSIAAEMKIGRSDLIQSIA
ncbi:hypothetical protein NKH52_15745 [Mesorhizobium sp. M1066]|uniref:hypothetical protein n=1 Tax=unclassified Mesorhizobium TaxID=325217 RepID=UPI003337556D